MLARRGVFRARHLAEGSHSPWGMARSPLTFPPRGMPRWARGAQSPAQQEDGAQGMAHAPRGCPSQEPPQSQAGKFGTGMTQLTGDHLTGCPCIAWQAPLLPPSHPAPGRHWLVMDLHSSHMRLPAPCLQKPLQRNPKSRHLIFWGFFFCLQGSLMAPAKESKLSSPATDSGQHPPLGEHQPRRFHWDPSWEESSLHPENKNLFPCSHLQPEQRPPSSTDADLCYWRMNLLSWEMLLLFLVQQNGGLFPTQGSYSRGRCCSETSAGPCVQTECSPQPSARPAKCTALLDRKNRDVSRQEGCRARTAGEGGMATTRADHRVESPQSQMPHRVSGETFVFCGLFFPSRPPQICSVPNANSWGRAPCLY